MAKAKEVIYIRTFSLGQFEGEKIGITLELEEGDKASDVLAQAKKFVVSMKSPGAVEGKVRQPLLAPQVKPLISAGDK